jgi:hypothetical protein
MFGIVLYMATYGWYIKRSLKKRRLYKILYKSHYNILKFEYKEIDYLGMFRLGVFYFFIRVLSGQIQHIHYVVTYIIHT